MFAGKSFFEPEILIFLTAKLVLTQNARFVITILVFTQKSLFSLLQTRFCSEVFIFDYKTSFDPETFLFTITLVLTEKSDFVSLQGRF